MVSYDSMQMIICINIRIFMTEHFITKPAGNTELGMFTCKCKSL